MHTNPLLATLLPLLVLAGCAGQVKLPQDTATGIGVDDDTGEPAADPDITVDPLFLDLGVIAPNALAQATFTVANIALGELSVTAAVAPGDSLFTIDGTAFTLVTGGTQVVTVSFLGPDPGLYDGEVTLVSNDPDEPSVVVQVSVEIDGDLDDDGYVVSDDCDDTDATVNPGADDLPYDGIDSDCDGRSDYDADGDGYDSAAYSGDDCDDSNASVSPGTPEDGTNGIDDDCDGAIDEALSTEDRDGDGYSEADGDCDDGDATTNPGAAEAWYDGFDQDCSGGSDYDQDGDGADSDGYGGTDCDDANAAIHPGTAEVEANGVDDNCDGGVDEPVSDDGDGDGYLASVDDCDDRDAAVNPGASEVWYDGVDQNCDGLSDYDQDGDGVTATVTGGLDCDDLDPTISPSVIEVCDGIDNNCDGAIDEGLTATYYADGDTDGYGLTASSVTACAAPAGYATVGSDCDDSLSGVNPGAAETCNLRDDDCDGLVDDGVTPAWYADADSDTYGSAATSTVACASPAGYVASSTDCDDGDAGINPAAVETCDGVDEDCDGLVDDGTGAGIYYLDADTDGYGDSATGVTNCGAPAGYVSVGGDCDDTDDTAYPSAPEIAYDIADNDCDGYPDDMLAATESGWTVLGVRASDAIGSWGVHATDDLDGDGNPELVIAAGSANTSSVTDAGYLAFHDNNSAGLGVSLTGGYYYMYGSSSSDFFGSAFVVVDDLDGGGVDGFAIGSYQNDSNEDADGQIYLIDVYGETGSDVASSSSADGVIRGEEDDGYLGYSLAAGDFDGDGTNDLASGAPGEQSAQGRVYVTFADDGLGTSDIDATDSTFYMEGVSNGDHLGYSVAFGDLTDDGYDDLVACSPDDDDTATSAGTCWVVAGTSTRDSTSVSGTTVSSLDTAVITGSAASDQVGLTPQSLSIGDIDGDGVLDLAVGTPGYDGATAGGGGVWIYLGGTLSGSETVSTAAYVVTGDGALGTAVNMTGDVTGDGEVDLLAGATTAGGTFGRVYLFEGGRSAGTYTLPDDQYASWIGEAAGDGFGTAISGLQDLDGDGRLDFGVSASGNDDAASGAGKVYVIPAYP